ncbi:type I-G CRISPR-associated protein Csb2 [Gimesia panareensis]|uniref:type I-G CRISPR-associated protein Csb2 n=1 Tax=Gimesia panareensis TaxID=2527978 RepID=UPI00118D1001|nr:type I-U CRISPR-associated protein Csb2 [Gimesia panareensis]QDU47879.1 CRISPR-associated protein, family (Cas_GSU0054) [Gimesia panareensis]
MGQLTIAWEYLTGCSVATNVSDRQRAEWPPHPARVFMALVAAWFETERDEAERAALCWLETLGDPELLLPPSESVFARSIVDVYVPVNDTEPINLGRNKLWKSICEQELITESDAQTFAKEINKKAKNTVAVPTILRMQLLERLSRTDSEVLKEVRRSVMAKVASVAWKDFVLEAIDLLPQFRGKRPRTFPTTWVGDAISYVRWSSVDDLQQHTPALRRLCSKVTRIGHASSLVRMWIADELPGDDEPIQSWEPTDTIAELYVRKVSPNFFESLKGLYGEDVRMQHEQLSAAIESLKTEKKTIKGKGAKERNAEIDQQISAVEAEREFINPHPPIRPVVGLWLGYRRVEPTNSPDAAHSHFDTDLLILTQQSGARLPLDATLQVTQALRRAIMVQCGTQPTPEWVSGHSEDGKPSKRKDGHLAVIPLPFVGHKHADGHLLGVALALPRSIARHERGECIGPLLLDHQGQPKTVELTLGRLGVWTLSKREWSDPRFSLKPESWTANPRGATTWGSVTPVVLDRFPKSDRLKDRVSWNEEVVETVKRACVRIGLPKPIEVDLDTTSWLRGVPRATGKRRRLRNGIDGNPHTDAALGDGFPAFPAKGTNASRPQIHVWLRFAQPVVGPVLIGAGRYLGYGLFKPLHKIREGELS